MTGESSHDDQLLIVSHIAQCQTPQTYKLHSGSWLFLSIKKNEVPGYTKLCTSLHVFCSGILYFLLFQK